MAANYGTRLTFVILLLISHLIAFLLELTALKPRYRLRLDVYRRWVAPIFAAALVVLAVCLSHTVFRSEPIRESKDCGLKVDADIAGDGVRAAAFIQVAVLIVVSIVGSFHPRATGAKELGGGLASTALAVATTYCVRWASGSLTVIDAAIGAMILDGQGMAIAIQLTAKETLTARWQTSLALVSQFLCTVVAHIMFHYMPTLALVPEDSPLPESCACYAISWWALLNPCSGSGGTREKSIFGLYFACRYLCCLQTLIHGFRNMPIFDKAEKDGRDTSDERLRLGGTLVGTTYPQFTDKGMSALYGEYTATVSFMYAFYGALSLASLVNAEITLRTLRIEPSAPLSTFGQIFALVVAGLLCVRTCFLYWQVFHKEKTRMYGLKHPFRKLPREPFRIAVTGPHYHRSGDLQIGQIMEDPYELNTKYTEVVRVAGQKVRPVQHNPYQREKRWTSHHRKLWIRYDTEHIINELASSMRETILTVDPEYLKACRAPTAVTKDCGNATGYKTAYLVVHLEIASADVEVYQQSSPVKRNILTGSEEMLRVESSSIKADIRDPNGRKLQDCLYAYSVREVTFNKYGKVIGE